MSTTTGWRQPWTALGAAAVTFAMTTPVWAVTVDKDSVEVEVKKSQTVEIQDVSGRLKVINTNKKAISIKRLKRGLYAIRGLRAGAGEIRFKDKYSVATVGVSVNRANANLASGSVNGRLLASNCFQCHGTNGTGGFERLTGESANEIYGELREFASGKEDPNGIMAAHAMGYTDEQMRAIANYFASVR